MALPLFIFSQNKAAEKANELFKLEQYTPAATQYEEAIKELEAKGRPSRSLLNLRTKLAFCYRVNNRMEEAEAMYAKVVGEDRAKAQTYFYFGETLMANGKYGEAKKWFSEYQKLEPEDEKTALMIKACDEVQFIEPYFEYVDVQPFAHNSIADDNAAVEWENGIVFSSDRSTDRKIKVNILEEKAGWTGRDYLDIYFSKKKEDGTYGEPKQFSNKLSELNKNTGNTSFTLDGSEVFFTRNDNVLNKQKTYNLQLFYAENENGKWRNVTKLPFCSPNYNFMHPAISPDGKMLFFATDKGGGQGGTDIWVSIREGDKTWSKPENLGPAINTSANEGFPFMDKFGRLYFCSKGHVGYGGFDIFFTEMTGAGLWKKPVNLGQPINSPLDDISIYVDGEKKHGMFSSSRKGGDDDIFLFEVLDSPSIMAEEISVPESGPEIEEILIKENKEELITENKIEHKEEDPITEKQPEVIEELIVENIEEEKEEESIIENNIEIKAPEIIEESIPKNISEKIKPEIIKEIVVEENISTPEIDSINLISENIEEEISTEKEIEKNTELSGEKIVQEPLIETEKTIADSEKDIIVKKEIPLSSFSDFLEKAEQGELQEGDNFRVDNAVFDANIYQLTPNISKKLDEVVSILLRFPSMNIELSAHTESLGEDSKNMKLSEQRAEIAKEYMVREGINPERLIAVGQGENELLNHCENEVPCEQEEHLFNQRLEIKILAWGRKQ